MFKIFKKNTIAREKKSSFQNLISLLSKADYNGDGHKKLRTDFLYSNCDIKENLLFYEKVAPLRYIIDKIAASCSQIDLKLKINGNDVDNNSILDLINNPNPIQSKEEFFRDLFINYLATGNIFIQMSPNFNEMYILPAHNMTINNKTQNSVINIPSKYQYSFNGYSNSYILDNGLLLYKSITNQYLLPILDFKTYVNNSYIGVPKTFSLKSELEQWVSGNLNNLSQLERGGRPSMAWVNNRNVELTDDQYERIKEQKKNFEGSANAGGVPILDGLDVKVINQSNVDMQFQELRKENKIEIANAFGFPLQLLLDSSMTYNNLSTSMVQYYNNAVLPVTKDVINQLNKFLSKVYKSDIELYYNEADISALRYKALEETKLKGSLNITTINELRSDISLDPIANGDEVILPTSYGSLDNLDSVNNTDNVDKNFNELKNSYVKLAKRS